MLHTVSSSKREVKMRRLCSPLWVVVLLLPRGAAAAEQPKPLDLRRAVPADAYVAVYAKHNPERDYQRQYYQEVWDTVRETRILERAVKIVTDRVPAEDLEKAKAIFEELQQAAAPIDLEAIMNAQEVVYAQTMQVPSAQHLVLFRLAPEAAAATEQGVKNLFAMAEKYSEGALAVETAKEDEVSVTTLAVPPPVMFRPTVARIDDVLLLSSSDEFARRSLGMLLGGEGPSKFDDPRLKEALGRLPEPEDSLTFYDGKLQFSQLREMGNFIRQMSGGDPDAERIAGLVDLVMDEVAVLDYEVTVEYTEGNQNRSAAYGKVLPGCEDKLLMKVFGSGQAFENWQTWVPAEALSYSLSTGANLHPAYQWGMAVVKERFPEAHPALEQFEKIQAQLDVHLDRDILQAFSGEYVSVSLPAAAPSALGGQDSVIALRCHKPERIRELLHRLVDWLGQFPAVQAQQLKLSESAELEGFDELSALPLALFGVRPAIGFRDGWMMVGSNARAVRKVLDTRAGSGETIAEAQAFKQFGLEVEGPVDAISYTNLAEQIRQIAGVLNQVGTWAPIILGMVGVEGDAEELKPVQEVLALLPSVAQIVAKFDFLEAKLSVTQPGDDPLSYVRRSVTLVRAPSGG